MTWALLATGVCSIVSVQLALRPNNVLPRLGPAAIRDAPVPERLVAPRSWWMSPWLASAVAAFTVSRLMGGLTGWVLGAGVGVFVYRWIAGLEDVAEVRRRARVVRDLPVVTDLLVGCLEAGRAPQGACRCVSEVWDGPVADVLRQVVARFDWGADSTAAWLPWLDDPEWAPVARAFVRSGRSGSSVTETLSRTAVDLRRRRRWAARAQARSIGVRTAAPLGLCFLPAFFLVGVVPTIAGVFSQLQW